MKFWRRVRGVVGLATTWAAAFVPLGALTYVIVKLAYGVPIQWSMLPTMALRSGIVGAICGLAFSAIVLLTERRQTFARLSLGRMATWGALGGVAFPVILLLGGKNASLLSTMVVLSIFGTIGAALSVGTLMIARRSPQLSANEPYPRLGPSKQKFL